MCLEATILVSAEQFPLLQKILSYCSVMEFQHQLKVTQFGEQQVKMVSGEFPHGSVEMNLISIHEDAGSIPSSLSGLRIQCCRELWCRLQMRLRSGIAVTVAQDSDYSYYLTPSLGTCICLKCILKKTKKMVSGGLNNYYWRAIHNDHAIQVH